MLIVGALAGWYATGQPTSFGQIALSKLEGDLGGSLGGSFASGADCGTTYRVRKGDTLQGIALEAYGKPDYKPIFEANRNVLSSASRLDIGDELVIPCLPGTRPAMAAAGPFEARADAPLKLAALDDGKRGVPAAREAPVNASMVVPDLRDGYRRIAFVTGSDFAPFVHSDLPESGMTAEMIRLAMISAAPEQQFGVAMVADWSTHLDLLTRRGYDLGFPWFRPDCTKASRLAAELRRRCAEFDFSQPLFEIPVGYYVLQNSPLARATAHEALRGRRICRPANHFTFDFDQQGLAAPETTLIFPPAAEDCFRLLERGEVDMVSLGRQLARAPLTRLGLLGRVIEAPGLTTRQSLHVIVPRDHPQGRALLNLVDAGLDELKRSGRWFEVVSRHLGDYGMSAR